MTLVRRVPLFAIIALQIATLSGCSDTLIEGSRPETFTSLADERETVTLIGDGGLIECDRSGEGHPVILLHGWPQDRSAWRFVHRILAEDRQVLSCDLPGIGESTNDKRDFTKTRVGDIVVSSLQRGGYKRAHVIGHDVGGMVAYAIASQHPEFTSSLTVIEATVPGTEAYEAALGSPAAWYFWFHQAQDVPETIVSNDLDFYISNFLFSQSGSEGVPDADALAQYLATYRNPATLEAGFELYRAMPEDARQNRSQFDKKLQMPVFAVSAGDAPHMEEMMTGIATNVTGVTIDGKGHWLPEEASVELSSEISRFIAQVEGE